MEKFSDSELIINSDGSIYHLRLKPEQLAHTIIVTGDPQRVPDISKYFDSIEWEIQNREIISHTGYLNTRRVTVLSTGMGADNIDIVVNELDALVNIDLKTRRRKEQHTALNIIRLGTSGAIQPDIPLNGFIVAEYALGLDGVMNFYADNKHIVEKELSEAFIRHTRWPEFLSRPYAVKASQKLIQQLGDHFIRGITITAPGFYGPQGRSLRLKLAYPELNEKIVTFRYQDLKITNFEMESSALYGLCGLLGHHALTICIAVANRATGQFDPDYKTKIDKLIQVLLERLRNKL
ncbi:MAG: nucleoside phosphorylase [Bacteroidetes bacterium]|nr:nucleoside phosphorylase [Bacteroidota bacterium]